MILYLIDGTAFIYRAYHAVTGLRTTDGFPTNAIHGFIHFILKIIRLQKPEAFCIVFDSKGPTKKHALYPKYKATRKPPDDNMLCQIEPIKEIMEAFHFKYIAAPGYEADDILATIAKTAAKKGDEVFIVTSDKDLLQVVTPQIKVFDPVKNLVYDEAYVFKRFQLKPDRLTELMALTGDAADNIPGAKGVGGKSALHLLTEFASLDDILLHPEKIAKQRLRTLIVDSIENIRLSRQLVTIDTDLPIYVDYNELILNTIAPNWDTLKVLFTRYELNSFMALIPKENQPNNNKPKNTQQINNLENLNTLLMKEKDADIALILTDRRACFSFNDAEEFFIDLNDEADFLILKAIIETNRALITYDFKNILKTIKENNIIDINNLQVFDTLIGAQLLNPNEKLPTFEELSIKYLGINTKYVNCTLLRRLKCVLHAKLQAAGLLAIYECYEVPLFDILSDMEVRGICVNMEALEQISKELNNQIIDIEKRIYFMAGIKFNINASNELSSILFEKLALTLPKKVKSTSSTDNVALKALCPLHPLPAEVLEYNTLTKLKAAGLDLLLSSVNKKTDRLHIMFNQTSTVTTQIISTLMQSIPAGCSWLERISAAFTTTNGCSLLCATYPHIELRLLAHLSKDPYLIAIFTEGLDVNSEIARTIFGLNEKAKVTDDMKRIARGINSSIICGMSAFGLSETWHISQSEAKVYINAFFKKYEKVKDFINETIKKTKQKGYALTILGRKLSVNEFEAKNKDTKTLGQQLAISYTIQGSAADIMRYAIINVHLGIKKQHLNTAMLLQIHDELILETPDSELNTTIPVVANIMEKVYPCSVPLKVHIGVGKTLAEAHVCS